MYAYKRKPAIWDSPIICFQIRLSYGIYVCINCISIHTQIHLNELILHGTFKYHGVSDSTRQYGDQKASKWKSTLFYLLTFGLGYFVTFCMRLGKYSVHTESATTFNYRVTVRLSLGYSRKCNKVSQLCRMNGWIRVTNII